MVQAERSEIEPRLEVIITEGQAMARIQEMASEVIKRFDDKDPLFVCLLLGALPFSSLLMLEIARQDPAFHPKMDCMIVSTYKDGTVAGQPHIVTDLAPNVSVEGRHVIMLDDVVDTGTTAAFLDPIFRERGAADVDLIAFIQKTNPDSLYPNVSLYGFDAPREHWLTGMGMDNAPAGPEVNRWMASVAIVHFAE